MADRFLQQSPLQVDLVEFGNHDRPASCSQAVSVPDDLGRFSDPCDGVARLALANLVSQIHDPILHQCRQSFDDFVAEEHFVHVAHVEHVDKAAEV